MSEAKTLFDLLRQSADSDAVAALEKLVQDGSDRELCRINVLDFAKKAGINEERAIDAFLHGARLGIFDLSWNMLCPGCGGVLDAGTSLKTFDHDRYDCALCSSAYEPTLDEMVEVTFTVTPRVRQIAGHDPNKLPCTEYYRQVFWGSGMDLPDNLEDHMGEFTMETLELPPGDKALISLMLPAEFLIVFDPVTHGVQFIDVKGEPTKER
jgi:hypothetical protein